MKLALVAGLTALTALASSRVARADSCVKDAKPYEAKTLSARIEVLASKDLDGRKPGTDGDKTARKHIVDRMKCLGLSPNEQAFQYGKHETTTANVYGFIKGTDEKVGSEIIVIGAHYDHEGGGHLGANDNASGVTSMLAVAQWLAQKDNAPKRTIAFVAFGAEEEGMLGSDFYVKNAPKELPMDKVVQYINLDMTGSYRSKGFVAAMGTFAKQPARKALDKLVKNYPKLHVGVGGRARGSDHVPFCKAGVSYVFFWTPDASCYHESCDTADKIDLPNMSKISALAGDLAWDLAGSSTDLLSSKTKLGCGQKY